jgi:hypothetical protein
MKRSFSNKYLVLLIFGIFLMGCQKPWEKGTAPLFARLAGNRTGITFANHLTEDEKRNYLNYYYFYNGSGVAIGDINNDGLGDIYFGANQGENKLYLNLGDLRFKDITQKAGVGNAESWTTGVTMVDINNDGFLDIYVCNSGPEPDPQKRRNRLYINNGDLTFTESAAKYGLDLPAFSIQAYFFDFDRDNDLDMYLVNHRVDFYNNNKLSRIVDRNYERETSDYLFRNNGDHTFTNLTEESGVLNKAWGLSAAIGDFNNDGWEDVYVANDFVQGDYLYINNQDGTFTDRINDYMAHTSNYSMGCDLGDINNDGLLDLVVADMVPENHVRSKRLMFSMNTQTFQNLLDYYNQYQYMSNVLQVNNGGGLFSEVGQLAGINKTDWSWATLLADFDNDGLKDLFVTNGIKRDITDNDYTLQMMEKVERTGMRPPYDEVLEAMPGTQLANYIFRNKGDFEFEKKIEAWGLNDPVNSNGAAYGDLDNDGDLDLVVNNVDAVASVYENRQQNPNYLKVELAGGGQNHMGLGAKITVQTPDRQIFHQHYLSRGYLSSVSEIVLIGLGKESRVNKLTVVWPDQKVSVLQDLESGQTIKVDYAEAAPPTPKPSVKRLFIPVDPPSLGITFRHEENKYNDFREEILLPHRQSEHGPYLSVADVNGDKLEDFFIGGASGQPGELYLQQPGGAFQRAMQPALNADEAREDMKSLFFDFDGDGDPDLYVVSGGAEFPAGDPRYQDRLYVNDGKGNFEPATDALPGLYVSGLAVAAADIDGDNDPDLFVGGRNVPGKYPMAPASYILRNDNHKFTDITAEAAPGFSQLGMVNDALFHDINGDEAPDLVVAGEWMPVSIYLQQEGVFVDHTEEYGLGDTNGWWFSLAVMDANGDGRSDILAGNIGGNNKYKPGKDSPLHVYANDMDNSGTFDIVLSKKFEGELVPVRGRSCSSEQMPFIREKFKTYAAFANASIQEIFGESKLSSSIHYQARLFESALFINDGDSFNRKKLPGRAQFAPIRAFLIKDYDGDGTPDILGVGNYFGTEVETIRYDSPNAVLLTGKGDYRSIAPSAHGLFTTGDTRDMKTIKNGESELILISRNNDTPLAYRIIKKEEL